MSVQAGDVSKEAYYTANEFGLCDVKSSIYRRGFLHSLVHTRRTIYRRNDETNTVTARVIEVSLSGRGRGGVGGRASALPVGEAVIKPETRSSP